MNSANKQINLQYLVTGTGRCGTVYLARLLTSIDLPCVHEAIFTTEGLPLAKDILAGRKDFSLSYCSLFENFIKREEAVEQMVPRENIVAASSYMAAPFLEDNDLDGINLIHLVRDPLKVINSFVLTADCFLNHTPVGHGGHNYHLEFIYKHLPELTEEYLNPFTRACMYYVRWNELIESNSCRKHCLRHRIEDGPPPVLDFVGKAGVEDYYRNEQANKFATGVRYLSLAEIPESKHKRALIDIGRRYGYPMEN